MKKAKLSDVAKMAKVSITTASNVLNGKGSFSDKIKQRVFKVAEELNYIKNLYASSVAKKRAIHLGILFHEDYEKAFQWNFIRHMLIQLEAVITSYNYFPVMIPVSIKQKTSDVLKKIAASGTGALFSIHYGNRELFTLLEDQGVPVVIINNIMYTKERQSALFVHDDYLAARVIVALNEIGLFIPEDISIIAPGDTLDYNQPFIPRITTMSIDTDMLGRLSGQIMIERLNGNLKTSQVLKVKQRLIKRGSCRKL